MLHKNNKYELLTPEGWRNFDGIFLSGKKGLYDAKFSNGTSVVSTLEHNFFQNNVSISLENIEEGELIDSSENNLRLESKQWLREGLAYDIINSNDSLHRFIVNKSVWVRNCDEMAFLSPRVAKEFWTSISPTLSTGGKCIITSTPSSNEDQFAEIWFAANRRLDEWGNEKDVGENGFRPLKVTWEAHPDRDDAWAAEELARTSFEKFAREHNCLFVVFEETLINQVRVSGMEGILPIKVENNIRWYKDPCSACSYIIALDPAMGTGGNYAAIQVFELPSMIQVAEWQHNKSTVEVQLKILRDIGKTIESAGVTELFWSVENNTLGESALVVIRELGEDLFPGTMLHDPNKKGSTKPRKGFTTTNKNKLEACAKLKTWVESDKLKLSSKHLISELKTFIAVDNTYRAKVGATDDLISATLLAIRMINVLSQWDDTLQNKLVSKFDGEKYNEEDDEDYDPPMPIAFL